MRKYKHIQINILPEIVGKWLIKVNTINKEKRRDKLFPVDMVFMHRLHNNSFSEYPSKETKQTDFKVNIWRYSGVITLRKIF